MTDIALLIISSLSLLGLVFVIFLFFKLSQKFKNLKLDISTAFKDKTEVAVLNSNAEKDLISIKENIVSFTKQLQEYLNNSLGKIREDTKKTTDLLENLNSIVNQRDKDLDRFKKGYDLVRLRSFVLNIIEAISFLQNRKSEFTDEKFASYVNAYEKQLLRILDDLGIQSFIPKVGDIVTDVEGIEVIGSTPLKEGNKPNGVSEILSDGFIMNFQDGRKEILKTAQVNVFK
tara:strand:- start:1087 stop:1779 length:693 start_codon:yes stop_codon:yes gene_type:complete